jgi:hypothetical protein
MFQFAHVGSVGTSPYLAKVGDIALFHAPFIMSDIAYAQACRLTASIKFTILDCAALEVAIGTEKSEPALQDILEISREYGVSEVVCPDTPADPKSSLKRSMDFIRLWKALPGEAQRPRLMVVPHAQSVDAWFTEVEHLIRHVPQCTVGIPRVFAKRYGGDDPTFRVMLAKHLRTAYPMVQIHLLGAGENFLAELPHIAASTSVRSVDSTFIHRYLISGNDPKVEYARPVVLRDSNCPIEIKERTQELKRVLHDARKNYG